MLINQIILLNLLILININYSYQFKQFKENKNIKCPFVNLEKIDLKPNIKDKNVKKYKHNKHEVLITYPSWKSKENKNYNPKKVDWSSVISGCHAACNFDKRLCNFYVRASAHDSLSIAESYGGPDGSLVLTQDELNRPENNYDLFAYKLSKNALSLAKRFDASVADIISVCGAYAVKYTGGIDIIGSSTEEEPFLVGRMDSTTPNPANQLVPENADTNMFNEYANKFGFTLSEFTALLGSHALIDEKECLNKDRITYCDPLVSNCNDISMYYWDNSYYQDLCSKNITIEFNTYPNEFIKTKKQLLRNELCKFTSDYFRNEVKQDIGIEFELNVEEIINQDITQENNDLMIEVDTPFIKPSVVKVYDMSNNLEQWRYTTNDAWLGLACQNKLENNNINNQIQSAMNMFKNNEYIWDSTYTTAYKKMINNNVKWFKKKSDGFKINGNECNSGYKTYIIQNTQEQIKICKTAFGPDEKFYE